MSVHDHNLDMPLSHDLPRYYDNCPLYDRLPGRIGKYISETRGQLTCIDVGANIGDTVIAFRQSDGDRFLAIEPNPKFAKFLKINLREVRNVTHLPAICSSFDAEGEFAIEESAGTASLRPDAGGIRISRKSLDRIVDEHPDFLLANVIKVDTDGHDFEVIAGAVRLLGNAKPFLLFECDPFGNGGYFEDCVRTISLLNDCGYEDFLVYDNFGNLIGRYSASAPGEFMKLLFYQVTSARHYYDLLMIGSADFARFHRQECEFFGKRISNDALRTGAMSAAGL